MQHLFQSLHLLIHLLQFDIDVGHSNPSCPANKALMCWKLQLDSWLISSISDGPKLTSGIPRTEPETETDHQRNSSTLGGSPFDTEEAWTETRDTKILRTRGQIKPDLLDTCFQQAPASLRTQFTTRFTRRSTNIFRRTHHLPRHLFQAPPRVTKLFGGRSGPPRLSARLAQEHVPDENHGGCVACAWPADAAPGPRSCGEDPGAVSVR